MLDSQRALYGTGVFDVVRVAAQNPEKAVPYQNVIVHLREASRSRCAMASATRAGKAARHSRVERPEHPGLGQRVDLRLRGSAVQQAGSLSFQRLSSASFRSTPT